MAATREPIRAPELSELETFVLALEEGSIARAAGRLRISTQAAAKRIRQLEVLAQTPLLVRGRRGVTATETGARLYPIALDLLTHRNRAVAALGGAPDADPLRIAGMHQLFGRAPSSRSEESFKNTEALLAAVFHATAEAVALIRPEDGLIHEINDAAVRLLGYEQRDLRGRTARELNIWEDVGRRDECIQLAISTGEPQHAELVLRTRAGERLLAAVRFDAVELRDGIRVLVTSRKLRSLTSSAAIAAAGRGAGERLDKKLVIGFSEALRAGVGTAAVAAAEAALDAGANIAAVHTQLIEPAMRAMGELWERAEISVGEEHLATAICQEVAAHIFFRALLAAPARRPGRVMMTAVQGEQHVLGLRLASDVLVAAGYHVLYLGADVPLDALLAACRIHQPEVVGFTVSMWPNVPTMIWEINEISQLEQPPRVIVGGRAVVDAATQGLAAPVVAHADQVLEAVEELLAAPPNDGVVSPDLVSRVPLGPPAAAPPQGRRGLKRPAPPSGAAPPSTAFTSDGTAIDLRLLASEICSRYRSEFPDEEQGLGQAVAEWCLHDNQYLLAWAIQDARDGTGLLSEQVVWLMNVLSARDFPIARLVRDLELAEEVARSGLPPCPLAKATADALAGAAKLIAARLARGT